MKSTPKKSIVSPNGLYQLWIHNTDDHSIKGARAQNVATGMYNDGKVSAAAAGEDNDDNKCERFIANNNYLFAVT